VPVEPGSLDPWRDVVPHGLTAGYTRSWRAQGGVMEPEPHRVLLIDLVLQPGVLRLCLSPAPADPVLDLTVQSAGIAKQQGTRWLQRIARQQPVRGTLAPWRTLSRAAIPQSLRSWYGPGGATATMSMQVTPGGVILECRGVAARTRRQSEPLLELLPFPATASERGEAWLDGIHEMLLP
jgi:hypothetical protein